jgi:hypothetical protein
MISKSILQTAQALAVASAMGMNAPAKKVTPAVYNTTNRSHKDTLKRKRKRAIAKASRKLNRKQSK